jgi:hypothetical protein
MRHVAVFSTFSSKRTVVSARRSGAKPIRPVISSLMSTPPGFDVMKIIVCQRSTRRLSPSVSIALFKIPSGNCHKASLAAQNHAESWPSRLDKTRATRL